MANITNDSQALLTGALIGYLLLERGDGEGFMKITGVLPDVDDENNYSSTFTVTFESGTVLSVSVNEVTNIDEE